MVQPEKIIVPSRSIIKKYRIDAALGKENGNIFFALSSGVSGPRTEEIPCDFILIDPALTIKFGPFSGKTGLIEAFHNQILEIKSYGDFTSQTIRLPEKGELDEIMAQPEI